MSGLVRVTDTVTGHHITISKALAARHAKRYQPLSKQAPVDREGRPLPPTYKTNRKPAGAPAAEPTTTQPEEAKK